MNRLIPLLVLLCFLTPARAAAKTKIEAPLFEGGSGKAFYLLAAREYEKLRPDVEVDMYLDPRIAEKLRVRFLEGTFPEIANAGTINYWPLIRNGDCVAIDKWLDGPSWDDPNVKWRDTFLPGALDNYSEHGKHYGIPLAQYAFVIWYNKTMFRERGWTTPQTWDELFALCEKVKKAGIAPLAFQGRYSYYAIPFYDHATYHLGGKEKFDARMMLAPGSIDDPDSVEAISLIRTLAQNYFQPGTFGMSHTESQLQFFLGKTAMIPCGAWLKSEMLGKIPDGFELGCFNLPTPPPAKSKADPSALYVQIEPFFVMARSPQPDIAMDFMRFMTSRTMASKFARMQDVPTAIRGANAGNLSKDLDECVALSEKAKISYGRVPDAEMQQVYADMMYDAMANTALAPKQVAQKYEQIMQGVRQQRVDPLHYDVNHRWKPAVFLGLLGLGAIWWIGRTARDIRRRSASSTLLPQASLHRLGFRNVVLFVAPALLVYTAFVIVPSLRWFSWSLHEWNGLTSMSAMPYRGLLNFKRLLFESDGFWIAIKNNLFLMFMVPLFVIPLAMFLAASISRGVHGATLFRVVFFFPNLLGGVAATLLWLHLYNPQGGLINTAFLEVGRAFEFIGLSTAGNWFRAWNGFAWLESKNLYWALIPIMIWGACGFNMVLYLAAMQSIPESYYEAATIDGASKWRQFWTITLPLIWDVLTISIVFLVIGGMKAFETIWLLTNQRPQTDNHVIATRMIHTMFQEYRVGEATALAVLLFLMVFVGTAATMRGLRRETVEM
ncbi:MAG: N-acetylglucosamine transport system substrate-binding protein [Humisphaera sp.]|nr:N-acetylglucosamine transport system substrate-binding protein [Humisphaera sp.]